MNRLQESLGLTALEEEARNIAPLRDEAMGPFGALAVNAADLAESRQEAASRQSNFELVSGFVNALPAATGELAEFRVTDPKEARLVQAAVVWFADGRYDPSGSPIRTKISNPFRAHYLIGSKAFKPQASGGYEAELLLMDASQTDRSIFTAQTWNLELQAIKEALLRNLTSGSGYAAEQLRAMSGRAAGELTVAAADPDSVLFTDNAGLHRSRKRAKMTPRQRVAHAYKGTSGLLGKHMTGGPNMSLAQKIDSMTLSDEVLEDFDTLGHLAYLAVVFGREDLLSSLIKQHASKKVDQIDLSLQEADRSTTDLFKLPEDSVLTAE